MPISLRDLAPFMTPYVSAEDRAASNARTFGTISGAKDARARRQLEEQQLRVAESQNAAQKAHWEREDAAAGETERARVSEQRAKLEREEAEKDQALLKEYVLSYKDPAKTEALKPLMQARRISMEPDEDPKQASVFGGAPVPQPAQPAAPVVAPPLMHALTPPTQLAQLPEPPQMQLQQPEPQVPPAQPPSLLPGQLTMGPLPQMPTMPEPAPAAEPPLTQAAPAPAPTPAPLPRRYRFSKDGKHLATIDLDRLAEIERQQTATALNAAVAGARPEDRPDAEMARNAVSGLPFGSSVEMFNTYRSTLNDSANRARQREQAEATAAMAQATQDALLNQRTITNKRNDEKDKRAVAEAAWKRDLAERKERRANEMADLKKEGIDQRKTRDEKAQYDIIYDRTQRRIQSGAEKKGAIKANDDKRAYEAALKMMRENPNDPQAYDSAAFMLTHEINRGATTKADVEATSSVRSWYAKAKQWFEVGATGEVPEHVFQDMEQFVESRAKISAERGRQDYSELAAAYRDVHKNNPAKWEAADHWLQGLYAGDEWWEKMRAAEGLPLQGNRESAQDEPTTETPRGGPEAPARGEPLPGTGTAVPKVNSVLKALDAEL